MKERPYKQHVDQKKRSGDEATEDDDHKDETPKIRRKRTYTTVVRCKRKNYTIQDEAHAERSALSI
jgi:hypothetical protein